ncbi:acyl-CoA dehydrogenase family protein [bacterium]|nr:acyl-CoA dehydrogenase family protein [bacterium]
MDFALDETSEQIRDLARDFATNELAPRMAEIDDAHAHPWDIFKQLGELGFYGIIFPEEAGGLGLDFLTYAIVLEEIATGCFNTGLMMGVHTMSTHATYTWGSKELSEKYVPQCMAGEKLFAFALSEPDYGSDAAGIKTRAVKKDGGYVINGTKAWITFGEAADYFLVMATVDPELKSKGITAFIVEKGWDGLSFGEPEKKMGGNGLITSQVILEDVFVPEENRVGDEGVGLKIALGALDGGRIGIAANATGVMRRAFDESLKYAKERIQFGREIIRFQSMQFKFADMAAKIEASSLLTKKAAWLKGKGLPCTKEASIAKLISTDFANEVCSEAVQVMGAYGYMQDYPVERLLRYIKCTQIFEGTNEIQRIVIAKHFM